LSDVSEKSDVDTSRRKFVRKMAYITPAVITLKSVPSYATTGSPRSVTKKKVAVKKVVTKKKAATKKKAVAKKKAAPKKKAVTKKKAAPKKKAMVI